MSNFKTSLKLPCPRYCVTGKRINALKGTYSSSAIDPHIFGQLIFDKCVKVRREDFQQMILEHLDIHMQKMNPQSIPHTTYKKRTLNRSQT